ncbi:hypothetical protein GGR56DRAFT_50391 [Xylariaceae sp. FL0804]|nr:hypothetical protein GGR56DRAFT_50391 [Xylariaceae sp. FL0804]
MPKDRASGLSWAQSQSEAGYCSVRRGCSTLRWYRHFCKTAAPQPLHLLVGLQVQSRRASKQPTMASKLTRIAIVNDDKCKPKKCRQECKKSCPWKAVYRSDPGRETSLHLRGTLHRLWSPTDTPPTASSSTDCPCPALAKSWVSLEQTVLARARP